jgi:CrcB protein
VAAGGAVGGAARWTISSAWPTPPGAFPWATFVENVVGCLLLAALLVVLLEVTRPHRYLRPFLGVGVLGGFTTFSAYTQDARVLLLAGESGLAVLYLGSTLLAGLLATWAGLVLARAAATTLARRTT